MKPNHRQPLFRTSSRLLTKDQGQTNRPSDAMKGVQAQNILNEVHRYRFLKEVLGPHWASRLTIH